jgi:5-deoxy-D-glucuronate isomerase
MSSAWLFRGTDRIQGRKRIIHEFNTGLEFLRYGRIVLGPGGGEEVKVESGDEEIGFVCLAGKGTITTDGQTFQLGKYDALYLPRDSRCMIASSGSFDVAEMASPASKKYPRSVCSLPGGLEESQAGDQGGVRAVFPHHPHADR